MCSFINLGALLSESESESDEEEDAEDSPVSIQDDGTRQGIC